MSAFDPLRTLDRSDKTAPMRFVIGCLALLLIAGCSAKQPRSGWRYDRGPYAVPLSYSFADSERTIFVGVCKPKLSFMMIGGDWEGDEFTLAVDDKSWTLPTSQGEHGHYLPVEVGAPVEAIASAKRRIVFQVGNWRRALGAGVPLTTFVADCRSGKLG
jgi:hypothetical protein